MIEFNDKAYIELLFSADPPWEELTNQMWQFQRAHNPIMQKFCSELGQEGPISMPISFFKHFSMQTGNWETEFNFSSSGTSGQTPSTHPIKSLELYERTLMRGFYDFFPDDSYRILALLPSYLERSSSSLVYMVKTWMDRMGLAGSGFYLHNREALRQSLFEAMDSQERILLIGVSFALLDLAEELPLKLPVDTIVMETGGMKGRKEEIIRSELHNRLKKGLGVETIYSEYGMTELMSQAYTTGGERFRAAPGLHIYISDLHLNRLPQPIGVSGRINIVDLANIYSCGFIATDDIGRMHADGSFEVLGRLDTAEIRGCSLMYG